jgi:hypothetical protein
MRRALFPVALLAFLAVLSCQQKPGGRVPQSVVADEKSAFVIMGDLPLWALSQGALTFKENLPIGEKLSLLGQTARAVQTGKERDFLQVRRSSGSEGWVRAEYVVPKSILGVVTSDESVIYSAPDNTAAATSSLPQMTVLAINADTGGMTFIRVTAYDPEAKVLLKGVYLRNEGVSSKPDDIQGAVLLQLAAGSKNLRQKQAFLTSAIKDYPNSFFMPQLKDALDALTRPAEAAPAPASQPASQPAQKDTEAASGTMVTAEDAVNVYDAPDQKTGKVLATLAKGQSVELQEKTTDNATIGDRSAPWYRIKDPAGWVFGASLGAAQ